MAKYILFNDKYHLANSPIIMHNNDGFLSGNYFNFEIIGNSSFLFFQNETYNFLKEKCNAFDFNFDLSEKELELSIFHLLQQNRIYKGFYGCFSAFKNKNNFDYIIAVEENKNEFFNVNNECEAVLNENIFFNDSILNTKKFPFINFNSLFNKNNNQLIITDINKNIISTSDSNIFFINKDNNIIVTKRQAQNGEKIIFNFFINFLRKNNFTIIEKEINFNEIKKDDDISECFLLNTINGITWVKNINKEKFFFHKESDRIAKIFNEEIKTLINLKKINLTKTNV